MQIVIRFVLSDARTSSPHKPQIYTNMVQSHILWLVVILETYEDCKYLQKILFNENKAQKSGAHGTQIGFVYRTIDMN